MYSGFKYKKIEPESKTNFICLTPDELKIGYEDIKGCNLILYDLQDIGIRESVAITLLIELLKLSAESRIPLLVLDRPNPLTAKMVGSPLLANSPLAKNCPIPLRHGLTTAELAIMINEEDWLKLRKPAILYVVPIANYTQSMWYDNTGLFHINAYLDKLNAEVALLYNSLFFVDHTNLSDGLGTGSPYEIVGAPWISSDFVLSKLVDQRFSGVTFINRSSTPKVARGVHPKPIYDGEECSGIQIIVTNRDVYEPAVVGSYLIGLIAQLYPHHFEWIDTDYIDAIFGGYEYRRSVELGRDLNKFGAIWRAGLTNYQILHEKYRLYPPE